MQRRHWIFSLITAAAVFASPLAMAEAEAPDALVKRISSDVLASVKADPAIQKGDISRIVALVDAKIMPNVNFSRMTSMAVGRAWAADTQRRILAMGLWPKALPLQNFSTGDDFELTRKNRT